MRKLKDTSLHIHVSKRMKQLTPQEIHHKFEQLPKVERLEFLGGEIIQSLENGNYDKCLEIIKAFDKDDASGAGMRMVLIATKGMDSHPTIKETVDSIYNRLSKKLGRKVF